MIYVEEPGVLPIVEWLKRYATAVERTDQDRWQFKLNSGVDLTCSAVLERDWLRLYAPLESVRLQKPIAAALLQDMLLQNAVLPGGVKFCLGPDVGEPLLAAEVPVNRDEEYPIGLDEWIGEISTGLRKGALQWSILTAGLSDSVPTAERRAAVDTAAEARLAETCEQAGWSYTTRANGQVAVRLDVRDAFCQAVLTSKVGKMHRLRVSLGMATSTEGESAQAVHLLLLSASRLVRLVRASAAPAGDAVEYRWEAVLPPDYHTQELGHALGALSVACQLTARELQAMEDHKIARQYLAMRGT